MNLRPLGDRVLIKPELPPTETESGLVLMEHRKPEQTGTVMAVGPCQHPLKAEAAEHIEWLVQCQRQELLDVADLLSRATQREPQVKVGDYVVFSWMAGQEVWVEHGEERYLLMRESDILCVVEGLEA